MNLSLQQLSDIMPLLRAEDAERYLPFINQACEEFQINTVARVTAFIAQLAHESGELHYFEEIWGPTQTQKGYEHRTHDLGNTQPGDGRRYKGRGPIQLTGRANYARVGDALKLPLVAQPELAAVPANGFRIAGHFWKEKGLNALADAGDFKTITRRINGGLNGYEDRCKYFERAKKAFAPKPLRPVLRQGAAGPDVKDLQNALVQLGYLPPSAVSARFGSDTVFAVQAFQKAAHLTADAIVGPATWTALNNAIAKRG
jgi:putative chitinase